MIISKQKIKVMLFKGVHPRRTKINIGSQPTERYHISALWVETSATIEIII